MAWLLREDPDIDDEDNDENAASTTGFVSLGLGAIERVLVENEKQNTANTTIFDLWDDDNQKAA